MAQATSPPGDKLDQLIKVLQNSWNFDDDEFPNAKRKLQELNWTASSLTQAFLTAQLRGSLPQTDSSTEEKADQSKGASALIDMAAASIRDELARSDDLTADLGTTIDGLPSHLLEQVLASGRTTYPVLRALLNQFKGNSQKLLKFPDVDDAVLRNGHYIRSRSHEANKDSKYLVTLEELTTMLGGSPNDDILEFQRKQPPLNSFQFLDSKRQRSMKTLSNSVVFQKTFDRITDGILTGLDWSNIFIAGGMALTTLMCTDEVQETDKKSKEADIDLYIYGLDAAEANAKVEQIYDVWNRNLPASGKEARTRQGKPLTCNKMVVKNAKTITLIPEYPNRRIQIILKLCHSPTHVLQTFDLDACALGYDGKQVLMLPRCARAIETGYSVFCMDLIFGHHLGHRRASREPRLLKYADRGFGIRILPSYIKALEAGGSENGGEKPVRRRIPTKVAGMERVVKKQYESLEAFRKPQGAEPGLKTLKRVVQLGRSFATNYVSTAKHNGRARKHGPLVDYGHYEDYNYGTSPDIEPGPIEIYITDMDHTGSILERPDARHGLGSLELLMRHSEIWRLDALGEVRLGRMRKDELDPLEEVGASYDALQTYEWNSLFTTRKFVSRIRSDQRAVFYCFYLPLVMKRLGHPGSIGEWEHWKGYFAKKVRRQTYGHTMASAMKDDIVIPLMIPLDVENSIQDILESEPDLPSHFTIDKLLTPITNPSYGNDGRAYTLPPLLDTALEAGNFRYWNISNSSMWAGQNRAIDEIFEVLWAWFGFLRTVKHDTYPFNCATPEAVYHLARAFRRRTVVLPKGPSDQRITASGLSHREAALFRAWVFAIPAGHGERSSEKSGELPGEGDDVDEGASVDDPDKAQPADSVWQHDFAFHYPIPDETFWAQEDEKTTEGEANAEWREWPEEEDIVLKSSLPEPYPTDHPAIVPDVPWDSSDDERPHTYAEVFDLSLSEEEG